MRSSFTAILEQGNTYSTDFATEPYEAAWATEARWFVRVSETRGADTRLIVYPEISPDGLCWCAEGSPPLTISGTGLASLPLRDFGHWLRLRCELAGDEAAVKVLISLALKE